MSTALNDSKVISQPFRRRLELGLAELEKQVVEIDLL